MATLGFKNRFWLTGVGLVGLLACNTSGGGSASAGPSGTPLSDDAIVGSCQAKDNATCDEYQNQSGLGANERDVELGLTKSACESLKNGAWREGKACEKKGEIGHCVVAKKGSLKHTGYSFKGDEEMTSAACTTLYEGKWESGLLDDALLGSCVSGTGCSELRNNKAVSPDSRQRLIKSQRESCERLEGEFRTDKGCEAAKATATCTDKGEFQLTTVRYELSSEKQALADAKELCGIGTGKFETVSAAKK